MSHKNYSTTLPHRYPTFIYIDLTLATYLLYAFRWDTHLFTLSPIHPMFGIAITTYQYHTIPSGFSRQPSDILAI